MSSSISRQQSKTPKRAVAGRLETEAGLNPAQCRVAIDILTDHIQHYHGDLRAPGVIIWTAVAACEPAGKPVKACKMVPVKLTCMLDADANVLHKKGSVALRDAKVYRWCVEAKAQGGLLSHEDLALLLAVDPSTVKHAVARLRAEGLYPPTRGAIKDMGPEPSHKRVIAKLLGQGKTTSEIVCLTNHSEHAIGRYQQQFGMVLYLRHTYPDGESEDLERLSELSHKAWSIYCSVADELGDSDACREHLQRLRRRYELDPEVLHKQLPAGKRPKDLARKRLEQQHLETTVRQTIQQTLGTTRRVAEVVTGDLMKVVLASHQLPETLRPGELTLFVDAHDTAFISGERVADRPVIPVTVPLYTDEIHTIWRSEESVGRKRARIATRIAISAAEQGGVLSVVGLAELLHVSPSTMAKDLRELAVAFHIEAPTKGILEDAGPTLTHKDWIVDLDLHGLTGEEISWLTRHAPASRDRYIATYRRAEALMRLEGAIPEPAHLAKVLRLRLHVAQQYVNLLQRHRCPAKEPLSREHRD